MYLIQIFQGYRILKSTLKIVVASFFIFITEKNVLIQLIASFFIERSSRTDKRASNSTYK